MNSYWLKNKESRDDVMESKEDESITRCERKRGAKGKN